MQKKIFQKLKIQEAIGHVTQTREEPYKGRTT